VQQHNDFSQRNVLFSTAQHTVKLSVSIHPSHHLPVGGRTEVTLFFAL